VAQTFRKSREDALNALARVLKAEWGDRCDRFETGCATCIAWAAYDMIEKITDGSHLDNEDIYRWADEKKEY
jgi:hypothetical protein